MTEASNTGTPSSPLPRWEGAARPLDTIRRKVRALGIPLALLAPALVILVAFRFIPIVEAVNLSFTDWDGFGSAQWVGLDNFTALASDSRFRAALEHTLQVLLALPIWVAVPYAIAWSLHQKIWGWKFFRFAFFVPLVLSPVVIGIYYGIVLAPAGPLNELLRAIGLDGVARAWLNEPSLAMPIVIAIIIWSTFGAGVLIFLSALSNIDQDLIDAAKIDGAKGWQIQRSVVFWQLLPVIEFWSVIAMIASFTAFFPLIYSLTSGGPGYSTYTVDYDLYEEAFSNGHLGYASAIGVAMLVVMVVIGIVQLLVLRRRRQV